MVYQFTIPKYSIYGDFGIQFTLPININQLEGRLNIPDRHIDPMGKWVESESSKYHILLTFGSMVGTYQFTSRVCFFSPLLGVK